MFRRRRRTWFKILRIKIYNARANLLFFSLNLLFGDVLVAVVVLVCL